MPKRKDLTKERIQAAMTQTLSVRATARYLNVSYQHLKKWMKFYKDDATGITLFDAHKNPHGKGIPKFMSNAPFGKKEPAILDIIEGRVDASSFNPQKLKYRMIEGGFLKEECHSCGFHERRVIDYKMPLIMNFKDGNKTHYQIGNVELLCYNCYFLYITNVLTNKDIEQLEDHVPLNNTSPAINFELDEYNQQRLRELGLGNDSKEDEFVKYL